MKCPNCGYWYKLNERPFMNETAKTLIAALEADAAKDKERIAELEEMLQQANEDCAFKDGGISYLTDKLSRYEALGEEAQKALDSYDITYYKRVLKLIAAIEKETP